MGSWKTTLSGIGTIVVALFTLVVQPMIDADPATLPNFGEFFTIAIAAGGLLFARDNDKSSEQVGAGNTGGK